MESLVRTERCIVIEVYATGLKPIIGFACLTSPNTVLGSERPPLSRLVLLVGHLGGRAGYSPLVLPLSAGEHFLDRSIDILLKEAYSVGMEVL